jgi:outer membrane protein assembly factor BamB
MPKQFFPFFFVISVLAMNSFIFSQDWPQWRGPNRDGVLPSFSSPLSWPAALKLKWKNTVGSGHSSPIVANGKAYLFSRQGENETISCFALDSGKLIWRKDYPAPYEMNFAASAHGKGPKSTPVVPRGRLYTFGISGIISCFDAETGVLVWRKEFSKQFAKTSPLYGVAMSPLVESNMLVAHVGGHTQGALVALDVQTGNTIWSWQGDGPGQSSPVVAEFFGTKQIVTQTQNYCVGIAAVTGHLLWRMPFTTDYDQNIVTPVVYKDMVIFSGLDKGTMAVKVIKQGDTWSTKEVWRTPEISMYMNSPVLSGELLFGLSHQRRGQFFSVDARTGATLWKSEGRQGENAAIISAGDVLFLLATSGELIVAKSSAKGFEPLAKYTVSDSETWAHPVVLAKQILIKDAEALALWSLE